MLLATDDDSIGGSLMGAVLPLDINHIAINNDTIDFQQSVAAVTETHTRVR